MSWSQIYISDAYLIGPRGRAYLFRTPRSYGEYTFFHPAKLVEIVGHGFVALIYSENWTWNLSEQKKHSDGSKIYEKTEIGVEEFCDIWPNGNDFVHHVPEKLAPEKTEPLPELLDED